MEYELIHYGVPGMKWGIRRSTEQLGSRVSKLQKKNVSLNKKLNEQQNNARKYEIKSANMKERNSKYESKWTKANRKKAKYDLKYRRELGRQNPNGNKLEKYSEKVNKYNNRMLKAEKKIKYNGYAVKAEKTKALAKKTQMKLEKNEKLMRSYNGTINSLDAGKIKQGRLFMQYVQG